MRYWSPFSDVIGSRNPITLVYFLSAIKHLDRVAALENNTRGLFITPYDRAVPSQAAAIAYSVCM